MEEKLTCFILEPRYWEDDTKADRFTKTDVERIYETIIEPAVTGFNFRILRSSDFGNSGAVEREHVTMAAEADLLIANITKADPMVHYCLGYRAALHKAAGLLANSQPIITMQDRADPKAHFYVQGPLAYPVQYGRDPNGDQAGTAGETATYGRKVEDPVLRARRDLTEAVRRWDRVRDRKNADSSGKGGTINDEDDPARRSQEKKFQAERTGPLPQETGYAAERSVGIFMTKDEDVAARIMSSLLKKG